MPTRAFLVALQEDLFRARYADKIAQPIQIQFCVSGGRRFFFVFFLGALREERSFRDDVRVIIAVFWLSTDFTNAEYLNLATFV